MDCDIREIYQRYQRCSDEDPTSGEPLNTLVELSECVRHIYEIRDDIQSRVDEALNSIISKTISDLLDDLHAKFESALTSSLSVADLFEKMKVDVKETGKVILQSKDEKTRMPGENKYVGGKIVMEKMHEFFRLLRGMNIFPKQIKVLSGIITEDMMRPDSYYYIEIPEIKRTVLINPAHGEATYVLPEIYDFDLVADMNKDEIVEELGAVRVLWTRSVENWKMRMTSTLSDSVKGMHLWDADEWKIRIMEKYEPEDILNMPFSKRMTFSIYGVPLNVVSNIVTGNNSISPVANNRECALFLREVYGSGISVIEEAIKGRESDMWDSNKWKEEFLKKCPTAESFFELGSDGRRSFNLGGRKIDKACSVILGRSLIITSRTKDRLDFAMEFFGISEEEYGRALQKVRVNKLSARILAKDPLNREYVIEKFREAVPHARDFIGMNDDQARALRVLKMGLAKITEVVTGKKIHNITISHVRRIHFAKEIYGEDNSVVAEAIKTVRPNMISCYVLNNAIKEFLEMFPEPEKFMAHNVPKLRELKLNGVSVFRMIKQVLGDEGIIKRNISMMAKFAKLVYGDDHECINCELWTKEEWIERVKQDFPTREPFMALSSDVKLTTYIAGKGLTAVYMIIVGRKGEPVTSSKEMSVLADEVYG